jgi:diguanylate cyclase (GGDEF)-like protein
MFLNIALIILTAALGVLLVLRERQLRKYRPLRNLEAVLASLEENIITSRIDGNIQKVAGQITKILIENLQAEKIILFRRQRNQLLINYIYGMKNLKRTRYRFSITNELAKRLTGGSIVVKPETITGLFPEEVAGLLKDEGFTLIFPIYWMDRIYGVYFISSPLVFDQPLIQTFLYFLNQNISATYHFKRLESNRQTLEQRFNRQQQKLKNLEQSEQQEGKTGDRLDGDTGFNLISLRDRDQLLEALGKTLKEALQTERFVLVAADGRKGDSAIVQHRGINGDIVLPDSGAIAGFAAGKAPAQALPLDSTAVENLPQKSRESIRLEKLTHCYPFALSPDEPGILFWSESPRQPRNVVPILQRLDRIVQQAFQNAREFNRIEEMSYTDSLTELYNYRYFRKRLAEEIERARRYKRSLGLLLFDIDGFKAFNDTFGHQQGDMLLREMGTVLKGSLRANDIIARYAGDEFCIIMPEADRSTSVNFMDRLRKAIATADFTSAKQNPDNRLTISVGGALYPDDAEDAEKLIYCADMALLQSKSSGRNKGMLFSEGAVS